MSLLSRYAFYGQGQKLHHWYDGSWSESLAVHYPEVFQRLVDLAIQKGYHRDVAKKDVTGWVKLSDPACRELDEKYSTVQSKKKNKDWGLVESMTLPGLMCSIIDLAKKLKTSSIPREYGRELRWVNEFIVPGKEWYNSLFAKDLYDIKPEWCKYTLSEEEQKEILAYMINKTGKIPIGRDPWIIPPNHKLSKFKGKIGPLASASFKKFGKKGLIVNMIEESLKRGMKPKKWDWFERNYAEDAKHLKEKYLKIINSQVWLRDNFTPNQQNKLDRWNKVAKLVLNDKDDYTLVKEMSSEERMFVGNHLKMLDQKMPFDTDKIRIPILDICEKIKKTRPILYELYCTDNLSVPGNKLSYWMADHENKQKQKDFIEKAKAGIKYQDMSKEERYSLSRFTAKDTKYLEFKKEIEQMRPDWFDEKLRKKLIRERHTAKKKEKHNEK